MPWRLLVAGFSTGHHTRDLSMPRLVCDVFRMRPSVSQTWAYCRRRWTSPSQTLHPLRRRWEQHNSQTGKLQLAKTLTGVSFYPQQQLNYIIFITFNRIWRRTRMTTTTRRKRVKFNFVAHLLVRKCWTDLFWFFFFLFLFASAPKCGFIKSNEKIMLLLEQVKPEIVAFRETIIVVSFYARWVDEHLYR